MQSDEFDAIVLEASLIPYAVDEIFSDMTAEILEETDAGKFPVNPVLLEQLTNNRPALNYKP